MTSPPPLYGDGELYRLLYGGTSAELERELDVSARPAGECRCTDEDPDRLGCARPYTFAGGLVKLSCSNGDRVCDYLNNAGFTGDDLDRELLARLDRAAERERAEVPDPETFEDIAKTYDRLARSLEGATP